jgi:divalent metal cation (Fe/Co/Zn/Cd) transporter
MKAVFSFLFLLTASAAEAHWSVVPHHHPYGVSMLPDLGTFIVGAIFLVAAGLLAYTKFSSDT